MSLRLASKTAVVTAAADGIGRASALAMAREGARVIAVDINEAGLASLAAQAPIEPYALNLLDAGAIAAFVARTLAPDVLFNCAGMVHQGTVLDCSDEDLEAAFNLNVVAMTRLIRGFLPAMIARGGGSIINMSSVASSVIGAANRFAYGATKAAVIGLTKSVSADFLVQGIRANAICPGTVDTPSLQGRISAQGDAEAARRAFLARQPMGRLGSAEEIAELVVYLASDESAFMSGSALVIDGGWSNV